MATSRSSCSRARHLVARDRAAVLRTAAAYAALGVKHGDRVATYAPTRPEIVITLLALARLGAWMVPVNPELRVEEVRYILEHAGVCGVACARERRRSRSRRRRTCRPRRGASCSSPRAPTGCLRSRSSPRQSAPLTETRGGADDVCIVVYTSGTTGFPKGVMHSQRNMVLAGEGFVERMQLAPDDRLMVVLPLFHINALFYSLCGAAAAAARSCSCRSSPPRSSGRSPPRRARPSSTSSPRSAASSRSGRAASSCRTGSPRRTARRSRPRSTGSSARSSACR